MSRLAPICFALLLGCPADPGETAAPTPVWPGEDLRPALEHPFFDEHPELFDLSLYSTTVEGPLEDRPDHQHRGAFGFGNGRAFSLLGLADPMNTLHSPIGPVYEKGDRFFGDVAVVLEVDEEEVAFEREWVARVRGTAVHITRADSQDFTLYTVDFAPKLSGVDPLEQPPALVRLLLVTATGDSSGPVAVGIRPYRPPFVVDHLVVEDGPNDERFMAYLPWEGQLALGKLGWRLDLGELAPGESARAVLVLGMDETVAKLGSLEDELETSSADDWLQQTLDSWAEFSARGLQVQLPDPRMEDLYDGMRVSIKTQQSAAGATCPMSEYTLSWLRDNIGPVRFFARAGLHDEAWAAADYLFLCASVEGDFSNACSSALSPDDMQEEPDWDNLEPFSGRLAAEGPSYVPLMYKELTALTGDWGPVQERWPYLRRAVLAQDIDEQGLQTFSGDETFRVAMSLALGHDISLLYEEETWSANSSFLMAAAADWMALAAERLGEDPAEFEAQAALARTALREHFLLEEGHYAPFSWQATGEPETRPFEDVNLKALWVGALDRDDPVAQSNLAGLQAAAGRGDGTVQTPLAQSYEEVGAEDGICTGMLPGYYLANLVALGDPEAPLAFDALHAYADGAGQYDEYMIYDDLSALSPIYDPSGMIGDYTAHFRPWEGGIDLDAYLLYLAGPVGQAGVEGLVLAPHLPLGIDSMVLDGLQAGAAQGRLELSRTAGVLEARFTSLSSEALTLSMELPVPPELGVALWSSQDGQASGTRILLPAGEQRVAFEPLAVQPGGVHIFRTYGHQ